MERTVGLAPEHSPSRILLASPTARQHRNPDRTASKLTGDAGPDGAMPGADTEGRADGPDAVIDLTSGVQRDPAGVEARRQRHATIVLAVVTAVSIAAAIGNFVTGMEWRSEALAAQDRATRAAAEVAARQEAVLAANQARDAAELERDAMAKQLAVSEADVKGLEARVAALADEKARAEDFGDYSAHVAADAQLRTAQAQVDSCVAQVAALRTAILVKDPASKAVQRSARAAESSCAQVGADIAALAAGE
jgi:hypothetical protein